MDDNEVMAQHSQARYYDPAKEPCAPLWHSAPEDYSIDGPGGKSTLTENNEKGILETHLFDVLKNHEQAELRGHNDPHRMGIYTTNSVGDND